MAHESALACVSPSGTRCSEHSDVKDTMKRAVFSAPKAPASACVATTSSAVASSVPSVSKRIHAARANVGGSPPGSALARQLIDEPGDIAAVLDEAEPVAKALVCADLGLQLVLDPLRKRVAVTASRVPLSVSEDRFHQSRQSVDWPTRGHEPLRPSTRRLVQD